MVEPKKDQFFDRELSWLQFNRRVLSEAMDETNPPLERLKFAGIVSSNLDEFFMVRAAGWSSRDPVIKDYYAKAFALAESQSKYFLETLAPELEQKGIRRIQPQALSDSQRDYVKNLFQREIFPLLTPIGLREDHPIPVFRNLSLYRAFSLKEPTKEAEKKIAVVEIPKNYSRMITLIADQGLAFILLEDVVALFASELFPGFEILDAGLFRVTRAAEFTIDEEKDEDFAKQMSEALALRLRGEVVRLEYQGPEDILRRLKVELEVSEAKVYRNSGWFDLARISHLAFQPTFPELKRPAWTPQPSPDFQREEDVWKLIREKDVLVMPPYESFDSFLKFLATAAHDPDVLAIKQTLYRTGESSRVIHLLEEAALNGKQVIALLELKARFDEERNIEGAERLLNAGASVLYGVAGFKTHAKACLVVRREPEGIRRYVHLATGNYNEKTAKLYSDIGFFSSSSDLGRDLSAFFNLITGYSHPVGYSQIDVAPYGLRQKILSLINRETMRSTSEEPGLIMAKMNSLVDPEIIDALYKASQKGVKIQLNVRGICCLKPGIKGLSETIEVTSVVDMFLEHSRIYYFQNGGAGDIYLSSADWMPRNLDRRLEIFWPLIDEKAKRLLLDTLRLYFRDNQKAWVLQSDGNYQKKEQGSEKKFRVQEQLCRRALDQAEATRDSGELKPQKPKST